MSNKMKRMLVLLLIILLGNERTAACGDRCSSSSCNCNLLGLKNVPQFLPTTIAALFLVGNAISTLHQSDLSRYSSLIVIHLSRNQISVINSRAFYNLPSLTRLYLHYNQLTSLRADMFVGLENLQLLHLHYNNIHSIEAGTFKTFSQLRDLRLHKNNISTFAADAFVNLPQLQSLLLSYNRISTFPSGLLSNLNISKLLQLTLSYNQMNTLPPYDVLVSVSPVTIDNNHWQCDCRMLPFKLRMTGFYTFEYGITCAGPAHQQGKGLLQDVNPEDLTCKEKTTREAYSIPPTASPITHNNGTNFHSPSPRADTRTTTHFQPTVTEGRSTPSSGSFSLLSFLSGLPGGIVGSLLTLAVLLVIRCIRRRVKSSPASARVPDPSVVYSNTNEATATVSTSGAQSSYSNN